MALHNVLPFRVPAPALVGRRQRARPADVIPLRLHRRGRHPWRANALLAIGAVVLWGAGIVFGLAAFRLNRDWIGDIAPAWPWWPIW
jgi:hypothetical protein